MSRVEWDEACEEATGVRPERDVPGFKVTTFAIGGPLSRCCDVDSVDELRSLVSFLRAEGFRWRLLGAGSNILIPDEGVSDWVIRLGRAFRFIEEADKGAFAAGGSTPLMTLSRHFSDNGYAGLEFAGGIPGSIGGALVMNAGAHGSSMADVVTGVRIFSKDGEVLELDPRELSFGYRQSGLPEGSVVLSVKLSLVESDRDVTRKRRQEMLELRRRRQPLRYASAGSVFRNPSSESPAGMLIEQAGLKGYRIGGAEISQLHANWIINREKNASAADVRGLMDLCRRRVRDMTNISLEPEIVLW